MRIRRQLGKVASAAAVLLIGTAAHAGARPFMPMGETIAPPPGYTDLCQRDGVSCGVAEIAPAQAAPTGLATFSIGGSAAHSEAATAQPLADAGDGVAPVLEFAVLRAYSPAIDERFRFATDRVRTALELDVQQTPTSTPAPAPTPVLLGSGQMRLVNTINREVNRDVRKATDFDLYGLLEYWSLPRVIDGKMYGDCEDYALEKRRRLIEAGVPESALSMAVAVTARGETHAVLVVSFASGDWVLDNLTPWATPWEDLNYRWVQRQVAGSSTWMTVG